MPTTARTTITKTIGNITSYVTTILTVIMSVQLSVDGSHSQILHLETYIHRHCVNVCYYICKCSGNRLNFSSDIFLIARMHVDERRNKCCEESESDNVIFDIHTVI